MPAIPSTAMAPAAFSSLSPRLAPLAPLAPAEAPARIDSTTVLPLVDDLRLASAMPSGGTPASWHGLASSDALASPSRGARVPRSIYDHSIVKKTMTNLIYEMSAANERGDGPLSNRELLTRLIEQAPEDGIPPGATPRLLAYRLPSLLLTERGYEPGTMKALYFNLGKLRSLTFREATTQQYVADGKAWLDGLVAWRPEFLVSELSRRSQVAVMLHAKANNVSGLDNWAASDGYEPHVIAVNAVAADHANHLAGKRTVVEAQIEARRVAAGYDAFDQAFMWLMNVVQSVPSFLTAPFGATRR
ncbi:hypothetical protein [Pandoraea pneumonica]|uniref:hypothetical protein n=1 Tax=Pandoraea pneumonica TaxID=2508299 RepID=UPI003CE77B0C